MTYPTRSNLPLTVWNLGAAEALYQPILGQQFITGQHYTNLSFWEMGEVIEDDASADTPTTTADPALPSTGEGVVS